MRIDFFVPGVPRPQGSKTAFYVKAIGRAVLTDACKELKPWREAVAAAAREAYQGTPYLGPVTMRVTFYYQRPKNHYGTGKNAGKLKPSAPSRMSSGYDLDKLHRAIGDAMTGIIYRDDSQIDTWDSFVHHGKMYSDINHHPGAMIQVIVGE